MTVIKCMCSHKAIQHNLYEDDGEFYCTICACELFEPFDLDKMLAKVDAAVTEIDLILWQWRADLDMLALAGVEVPLVLHKDDEAIGIGMARLFHDGGALAMTGENIVAPEFADMQAWRYLRRDAEPYFEDPRDPLPLVLHTNGEKRVIGTAEYEKLPNGDIMATGTVTEPVPELMDGVLDAHSVSIAEPSYGFSIPNVEREAAGYPELEANEGVMHVRRNGKWVVFGTYDLGVIDPEFYIKTDLEPPLAHYSLMPDGTFFNNITKKPVNLEENNGTE